MNTNDVYSTIQIPDFSETIMESGDKATLFQAFRNNKPCCVNLLAKSAINIRETLSHLSIEVLFDRATRNGASAKVLRPLRNANRERALKGDVPVNAGFLYRNEGVGIEVMNVGWLIKTVRDYVYRFCGDLDTVFERLGLSLLALPKDSESVLEPVPGDVFLLLVGPGRCLLVLEAMAPQDTFVMDGEKAAYFPSNSSVKIKADSECILVKIVLRVQSSVGMAAQYLDRTLTEDVNATKMLSGMLGDERLQQNAFNELKRSFVGIQSALDAVNGSGLLESLGPPSTPDKPVKEESNLPQIFPTVGPYWDNNWSTSTFKRRVDDIYIVTFPRSGTTWMQMVLYQILTDGDLDRIDHIFEFSPYLGFELRQTGDASRINGLPSPRVLKTHGRWKDIYTDEGRFIYIAREGKDVALSTFYHGVELGETPIPFGIHFDRFVFGQHGWFDHVSEWWQNREKTNVLFLTYRDLIEDLQQVIRRVAEFCHQRIDDKKLAIAIDRCSFGYMKAHEAKFHHRHGVTWLRNRRAMPGFIRNGRMSDGNGVLSDHQREEFQNVYKNKLGHTALDLDR